MACFVAPVAEAVIVSIIKKKVEKKEAALQIKASAPLGEVITSQEKVSFSQKLGWLSHLLWGGSFLLAIEHIWHGEVVPWFPFLTAMNNPADIAPMLQEIATVGVSMATFVTFIWGVMVYIVTKMENKQQSQQAIKVEG